MRPGLGAAARVAATAAAALLLGSCSYLYDVRAVAIGGRLAFVSTDEDYGCIANIGVESKGAARAVPAPGDNRGLVVNGAAYWQTVNPVIDCVIDFPVFYGVGGAAMSTSVAAKPLRIDTPYAVNTEGDGAYGSGCFRINAARQVENLAEGRCFEPSRP